VDIGGTSVELGAVAPDGRILATDVLAFAAFHDFASFVGALAASVRALGQRTGSGIPFAILRGLSVSEALLARVSLRLAATGNAARWLGAAVAANKAAARKTNPSEQP
jgi:hypothetical protein